ncbi:MAG: hypothetical protein K6B74_11490 [Ruminococcus sp.]|nr:hypothetical protein [Ruminococcus sp.]
MQEEAVRRVREMQKRSQSYIGQPPPPPPEPEQEPPPPPKPPPLLDLAGIKLDEEKALIGLLIYVLYKNNADMKLLLGLGYLLL